MFYNFVVFYRFKTVRSQMNGDMDASAHVQGGQFQDRLFKNNFKIKQWFFITIYSYILNSFHILGK